MKKIKKITAVILAVAMLAVTAGCGGDQSWSYKTDTVSLSAGTYIYNLLNGYYAAYDLVESPDEAEKILEVTVKDSDSEEKSFEQYAIDNAHEETLRMLAVEELFKQYDLGLDQLEYEAALSYSSQFWANVKEQFEAYGISQDSFNYCYAEYMVKYGQVFEHLYGKDGEKYVDDETMTNYFKDKYTGYAYFTVNMATTDEEGNSVAKSEEEFTKAEESFNRYADMINKGGKTYKEVVTQYTTDYELTTDPTMSGAVDLNDSTLDINVIDALRDLKENEATVVKTGEGATTMYYFVYKPVTASLIDFLETDSDSDTDSTAVETFDTAESNVYIYDLKSGFTHYTLLNDMMGEDYTDYLLEYGEGLEYSSNDTVTNKFKPEMFVEE